MKSHLAVQICTVSYVEYFVIPEKLYLAEFCVQRRGDSKYCNYLVMDILYKFYNTFRTQPSLKPSSKTHYINK